MSKKIRRYHATREVYDSKLNQKHTILVYGELTQTNEERGFILAPITYKKKDKNNIVSLDDKYVVLSRKHDQRPTRSFNFGWAICASEDEFDIRLGTRIAKKRFSDSPMTTTDVRFFSDNMIAAILKNELNFIEEHLEEKYLPDFSTAIGSPDNEETTFEIEVDEDEQKNNRNGCDGECKTCADEGCENRTCDAEELTNVSGCAKIKQTKIFSNNGDFIVFRLGDGSFQRKYGIVKTINKETIDLYWEFEYYDKHCYSCSFETNVSYKLTDITLSKLCKKENLQDDDIYNTVVADLEKIFNYHWDSNNERLLYVDN